MEQIVGSVVVEKAVDHLVDSMATQLGYIWNYKSNFENLEKQLQLLQGRRETVQHSIDEARRNGEEIEQHVVNWMNSVTKISDEAMEIIEDNKKANMRCFKSLCPNLKKRYQHSKQAEVKVKDISELHDEGKFDKISYRPIPVEIWHESGKPFEDFESRTFTFTDVINAVSNPDVNVIGIHGMGGIGKTTLAKEVGRKAEENKLFDSVVFVEVSEQPDLRKIQGAIADKLSLTFREETESGRARTLWDRLKKEMKVLLILDNLWERLDLEKIGIPLNDDHRGSKLLLTARNTNVLLRMDCQNNFPIGILNEKEAWNLFKKITGSCVERHDLQPLALDVAKRCGGLPIAIVTIAKALKNKQVYEWENALQELQHPSSECLDESVTQEAYSCIKLSYSHLRSDELKATFLLCCIMVFISNASVEELLRYGLGLNLFKTFKTMEESRNRVNTLIRKLKDSSLLLDNPDDEQIFIHDVVRDVGRMIAFDNHDYFIVNDHLRLQDLIERNTLGNCTSIFLHDIAMFPKELDCPHLTLFYMKPKKQFSIPESFFERMPNLEVLHLKEVDLSQLPASIASLKRLRTLYLDQCEIGDIAIVGDIRSLEILVLSNFRDVLPEEIGQLNRLRLLDLKEYWFIIPPKTIPRLTQLEELYMGGYWYDQQQVEELNVETSVASLEELNDLCHLTALRICVADAEVLRKVLVFEKLRWYQIGIGGNKWSFRGYRWIGRKTLRKLHVISDTNICSDDGVMKQLKSIEDLLLDGKQRVKNVLCELNGDGFPQLKHFHMTNNPYIQLIVDSMSSATCDAFPLLETFSLSNLVRLEKICHDQLKTKCFCQLKTIKVDNCDKLKNLFPFSIAKHFSQLQEIEVVNCKNMEEIFIVDRADNGVIDPLFFNQLHFLKLKFLPILRSICSGVEEPSTSQGRQMSLTADASSNEIILQDQFDALPLFGEKVVFPNLKYLHLKNINLKYLFSSSILGSIKQLQHLVIKYCKDLEELIRIDDNCNYVEFPSLKKLQIESCPELREFIFSVEVSFPSLQEIQIDEMENLKMIWQSQVIQSVQYCPKLSKVNFSCCQSLENVFPASVARNLFQLEELAIRSCGIKEIVAKEERVEEAAARFAFPRLTSLSLSDLEELRCFYPGKHTTEWPKLNKLRVKNCEKIDLLNFQEHEVEGQLDDVSAVTQPLLLVNQAFSNLEEVIISQNYVRIICHNSFQEHFFPNLKSLKINDDQSLIPPLTTLQKFHNLEELKLKSSLYEEILSYEEVGKHVGMFSQLKSLYLQRLPWLKEIWKQDSKMDLIIQKLEFLRVYECQNLINVMPPTVSFKNLKILKVESCDGLTSLMPVSTTKGLLQLEEMSIENCKEMTYIIANEGDVMEAQISFSKLKSLELHFLTNLISFYSGNYTFNFPLLEKLRANKCPKLKFFSSGVMITPRLQEVRLGWRDYKCEHGDLNTTLKQIHHKKVSSILKQSKLEGNDLTLVWNLFPERTKDFSNTKQLNLSGDDIGMIWQSKFSEQIFPKLKCLCVYHHESISFPLEIFHKFHNVEELKLKYCSYDETFSYVEVEHYARALAQIKCLHLHGLDDVKQMWKKDTKLDLLLRNLENLKVMYCGSLVDVVLLSLSFENLKILKVVHCSRVISLLVVSTAKSLVQLEEMQISNCKMMTEVVAKEGDGAGDEIVFLKLKKLELNDLSSLISFSFGNYTFMFPVLEKLDVEGCPNLKIFSSKDLSTPLLREVWQDNIEYICKNDLNKIVQQHHEDILFSRKELCFKSIRMILQKFPEHLQTFSNLEQLSFSGDEIGMLWQTQLPQHLFPKLKLLEVFEDESTVFPLAILKRFCNVEQLELNCGSYEELFSCEDMEKHAGALAQTKSLSLYRLHNLKQMWKQGSSMDLILQNLESLQVNWCGISVSLMPPSSSFQNLKILKVEGCDGLVSLVAPSTAKSLVQLEELTVRKCTMMTEVILSNEEASPKEEAATKDEIIFSKLWRLDLDGLSSLTSFCSGNYTFNFPCLYDLYLNKCPKMKFFSSGVLSTPELNTISHDNTEYFCANDLNATIQGIHEKLNAKTSPDDCAGPSTLSSSSASTSAN